jgi:hypothetical protein
VSGAERLTLAPDVTPAPQYWPHVQGTGVHHNPTLGPAGSPYVYGHVFVVLALLVHRPASRTKLELAIELLRWAETWLGALGEPLRVVADSAYAKKDVLKPARSLGVAVHGVEHFVQ